MAGKPRNICNRGHNKDITGREADGHCLVCRIEYRSKPHISTQQFCLRNHDTFVCGRTKNGTCKQCKLELYERTYVPHPHQPEQFCPHGHDTFVHGRDAWGQCRECGRIEQRERRTINRAIVDKAKDVPCADCGIKYDIWVMDFDHLEDKEFTISKSYQGRSVTNLQKEIAKCDVVCSNCHRIRTHNRMVSNSN